MALRLTFTLVLPLVMFACSQDQPQPSMNSPTAPSAVERYQCCLHPWMRLETRVSEK